MSTQANENPPEVIAIEMAKDRAVRREERQALTAIPASNLAVSPLRTSFMPQSMGEAMQLATIMARSTFVPGHCRGSEGNCLAIIMQASRWGMDPFAVANKAYFVKDGAPPAFEAQLVNAVVNSSGALSGRLRIQFEGEGEKLRCTVRGFLRADPNDEKVRTQSIARITVRNSPNWKSDPEQQMGYYTTRAWARLYCPEVLLGVYTPDEMEVDPERARVVSPARLPRRSDARDETFDPDTGEVTDNRSMADKIGDDLPVFDKQTGMSEVDEQTARDLDAGGQQGSDYQPEGRADQDRGEAHNGVVDNSADNSGLVAEGDAQPEPPTYAAKVAKIRNGIAGAKTRSLLDATERAYVQHCIAFPKEIASELEALLAKRKRELSGTSA